MPKKKHVGQATQTQRRAVEDQYCDALGPDLLEVAYAQYLKEGRGVIYIPMHDRAVDRARTPLYVQANRALGQFRGQAWFPPVLEKYDPRSELILVFGYPESVYIRHRTAIDPTTGERVRALDPNLYGPRHD